MKIIPIKMKKIQYLTFLILVSLFSCTPECPEIEHIKKKGNKVVISMVECRTTKSLFDVQFDVGIVENPDDSIINYKKYVHIPKDKIQINSTTDRELDFKVWVLRNGPYFEISIRVKEGNKVVIQGTDFEKEEHTLPMESMSGWLTTFSFFGSIKEIEEGVYQTEIEPSDVRLDIFNKNIAKFGESFTFKLSVLE